MKNFFVSVPHSGERVPSNAHWLQNLEEKILMCDVDRFVDRLYLPGLKENAIDHVIAEGHRYVVDLNRIPQDVDEQSVKGSPNPSGSHTTGLHWSKTTKGDVLMGEPISKELHQELVEKYYWPFHHEVEASYQKFKDLGFEKVYHLDAHSMPSLGTQAHRDPGEHRPEVVVSDVDGVSCESFFKDLVVSSYEAAGFKVAYNWPYKGGRVTQIYGVPDKGQHALQVELNRALYMDEETKQIVESKADVVKGKISSALGTIMQAL